MKIESHWASSDKKKYKLVRTDNYKDVPGEIVSADEENGECSMHVEGETKTISFGSRGFRIVGRTRLELDIISGLKAPYSNLKNVKDEDITITITITSNDQIREDTYSEIMGDCG